MSFTAKQIVTILREADKDGVKDQDVVANMSAREERVSLVSDILEHEY